jgi:ATP-dependent 26S proteasome regulatory subunit
MKDVAGNGKGYSGADLENIVNESAYIAIQNKRNMIEGKDLEESFLKIKYQKEAKQNG